VELNPTWSVVQDLHMDRSLDLSGLAGGEETLSAADNVPFMFSTTEFSRYQARKCGYQTLVVAPGPHARLADPIYTPGGKLRRRRYFAPALAPF
jgi:hypothetical protein